MSSSCSWPMRGEPGCESSSEKSPLVAMIAKEPSVSIKVRFLLLVEYSIARFALV